MLYKDFYAELGKLLYAVADIDKVITLKEKKALQDIVKKELVPAENHVDKFQTNSAYYAEMEFDFLDEEIGDATSAFESFIDFVEEHHTAIDEKMKNVSLKVIKKIADAYHGRNKKEQALINELKEKFNKLELKGQKKDQKKFS